MSNVLEINLLRLNNELLVTPYISGPSIGKRWLGGGHPNGCAIPLDQGVPVAAWGKILPWIKRAADSFAPDGYSSALTLQNPDDATKVADGSLQWLALYNEIAREFGKVFGGKSDEV